MSTTKSNSSNKPTNNNPQSISYFMCQTHLERNPNSRFSIRYLGLVGRSQNYTDFWGLLDRTPTRSDNEILRIGLIFTNPQIETIHHEIIANCVSNHVMELHEAVTNTLLYNHIFDSLKLSIHRELNIALTDLILYDIHKVKSVNLELTNFITHFEELK